MSNAINLADLPAPDVIEVLDFEIYLANYKSKLIELQPEIASVLDLESDPIVKLLEFAAWRELLLKARYNDEARALLLAYATGSDLDHIGYTYYRRETRLVLSEANPDTIPPTEAVLEDDEAFMYRLSLKTESYSVAGPRDAYVFHALSASAMVKHASCITPTPGTSIVTILSVDNNGIANQALLDVVNAKLSPDTIRPLCEEVLVQAAQILTYDLIVDLYTYDGPDVNVVVTAARSRLEAYVAANYKLGFDHTLSGWMAAAHVTGVQRVALNQSDNLVADETQAIRCNSITINHVGVAV